MCQNPSIRLYNNSIIYCRWMKYVNSGNKAKMLDCNLTGKSAVIFNKDNKVILWAWITLNEKNTLSTRWAHSLRSFHLATTIFCQFISFRVLFGNWIYFAFFLTKIDFISKSYAKRIISSNARDNILCVLMMISMFLEECSILYQRHTITDTIATHSPNDWILH